MALVCAGRVQGAGQGEGGAGRERRDSGQGQRAPLRALPDLRRAARLPRHRRALAPEAPVRAYLAPASFDDLYPPRSLLYEVACRVHNIYGYECIMTSKLTYDTVNTVVNLQC